jgi:uncharacterized membrane protein
METHALTIIKSISWRIGGFLMTIFTAWLVTRRLDIAASIGAADTVVKIVAYYLHERMWLKIPIGRLVRAEQQS